MNAQSQFCPQCGTPLAPNQAFCSTCGHRAGEPAAAEQTVRSSSSAPSYSGTSNPNPYPSGKESRAQDGSPTFYNNPPNNHPYVGQNAPPPPSSPGYTPPPGVPGYGQQQPGGFV